MQCKGNGTKAVSSVLTPQEVENLPLHQTQEIEMTDIVQRLRDHAYLTDYPPANAAADEIEQLRKEVAALTIPGEVRVDPDYFQKLRKIEEAARNLLSVKGRHHTEQAYQRLEEALK
jgi:hypothetical protein